MTDIQPTTQHIMRSDEALAKHPVAIYLATLGKSSRRTMLTALHKIAQSVTDDDEFSAWDFEWSQLEYQHTIAIRRWLADESGYALSTINRHLAALRGVLKECWRLGYTDAETYHRAVDIQNIKGETLLKGRYITDDEIARLIQVCDLDVRKGKASGIRDGAIIGLLWSAGLRRNEVIHLKQTDLDINTGELKVRVTKGKKERNVFVAGRVLDRLVEWIQHKEIYTICEYLFVGIDRYGLPSETGIKTGQTIYDMLMRRGKQAGLDKFSPHDFRRSAISGMLDAGVDLATTAKIVGHSDPGTTARYDRRDDEQKKKAAHKRNLPE